MNRYDDRARLVFHYAREEGSRLGHSMIGPEHLLLGLMREGGTAARILQEYGASLEAMRRMVEELVGRGEGSRTGEPPPSPRRRVMELASAEARNMGAPVIGTEHILLGIIARGTGSPTASSVTSPRTWTPSVGASSPWPRGASGKSR